MTLGAILRHHRQLLGLSQPALAQRASIEQSYLSKLENDHSIPSDEILKRLMQALDLDIVKLYAQLDDSRDPRILNIQSIRSYQQTLTQRGQRRDTVFMTLFTLAIGIGVALFYLGHSKAFFADTLYSYESRGELQPGDPSDYYHGGWRRAFPAPSRLDSDQFAEQVRAAEATQAARIDYHTMLSFRPLEDQFTRHLDNGNRRVYRALAVQDRVARPQNAWLMFIGITLAVSGLIALMIRLRLTPDSNSVRD